MCIFIETAINLFLLPFFVSFLFGTPTFRSNTLENKQLCSFESSLTWASAKSSDVEAYIFNDSQDYANL